MLLVSSTYLLSTNYNNIIEAKVRFDRMHSFSSFFVLGQILSEHCLFPRSFKSLKQGKMFHDETMPSFFRRPSYSPDGSLLIVPGEVTMVELFFSLHGYND